MPDKLLSLTFFSYYKLIELHGTKWIADTAIPTRKRNYLPPILMRLWYEKLGKTTISVIGIIDICVYEHN